MSDLLSSVKSDLLDRRMLPIALLLVLALAGAVAYAEFGGGSSSSSTAALPSTPASVGSSGSAASGSQLAVKQAPANPNAAVSETPSGARFRHRGGATSSAHDPFAALPSKAAAQTSASASTPSSSSSSPSSPSSPSTSESSTPTPTQPTPAKPKVVHKAVFTVSVLFGLAPTTPGQLSQLTPYAHLKRLEPLPSASAPLLVFEGVGASGKGAIFTLAREAILKGEATCLPSATQCEAIDLALGQSEELSYLEPNGETVAYELSLSSIDHKEVSTAKAARLQREDKAGAKLLRRLDPSVLANMRFSFAKGVLVYTK
jgi:hypothetical protein